MAIPLTSTENVHDVPGAKVAPDRLMLLNPAPAVTLPPPHEPVRLFGVDTISPAGSVSVKARLVSEVGFTAGLERVKVTVVLLGPNNWSSASANDLVRTGDNPGSRV